VSKTAEAPEAITEMIGTGGPGPAVQVRGLTKRFGGVLALDHVDMDVEPGEFVVLTGPSGAGKSTLIHLIGALERPSAGSIVVGDHEIAHRSLTRYRRRDVGLIFQLHNLIPRLTAVQNIEIAMFDSGASSRERRARATELLEAMNLGHRRNAKPPTLSGGERQRVAIARALANRPGLVLADEPTGSLDDRAVESVVELFDQLRLAQGVTILGVSHDPRMTRIASRLVHMEQGRVVDHGGEPAVTGERGPAGDPTGDPKDDEVARLVELGQDAGLAQAADWVAEEWSRRSAR
jgi:putative ABC transport system ATP-binding protein